MALNLFDLALQQEGARRAAATAAQAALAAARATASAADATRTSAAGVPRPFGQRAVAAALNPAAF